MLAETRKSELLVEHQPVDRHRLAYLDFRPSEVLCDEGAKPIGRVPEQATFVGSDSCPKATFRSKRSTPTTSLAPLQASAARFARFPPSPHPTSRTAPRGGTGKPARSSRSVAAIRGLVVCQWKCSTSACSKNERCRSRNRSPSTRT